jgi:methionine biosynthesis protein MetW
MSACVDPVRAFYEQMYAEGRVARAPGGLVGRSFVRLRRFELHRVPAAFALLEPGHRYLDIGCGDGTLLALARSHRYPVVYGLDLAEVVVRRAWVTCLVQLDHVEGVTLLQADVDRRLPFADGSIDAVTALAVLEHVFDPYHVVREVGRILRPGGQFLVEVPNLVWLPRRWAVLRGRLPVTGDEEGWDGGHLHYFTFATLQQLLREHGFTIERAQSTGVFGSARNVWPSLLGGNILVKARKLMQ